MRAFAFGMLIAICCLYLAFDSQKPPTFRIVKVKNGKKISNTTTVPSYFYDDTVDYCICFLICFIISLSSMSDFSTLYLSSFHIPLSLWIALSTLTLSLCAGGWASTLVCGSWVNGSVDCSQLSFSLVEGGDDSSRWRWTLTAGFCCRGSFLVMGLPPWAGFGHGFATVGAFGSWFCRRWWVLSWVCCSGSVLAMGLLPWIGFVHGSAIIGRFCHGLVVVDVFWLWVCCCGLWVCCHGLVLVMGYWWWGECEWRVMKNLLVLCHENLDSVSWWGDG